MLRCGHARLRGAAALAAQIEIDDDTAGHPIAHDLRRWSAPARAAHLASLRRPGALKFSTCPPRSSWSRTPAEREPSALRRTDHEGQVETRVACAAVEVQPFGPRVLPHRRIRARHGSDRFAGEPRPALSASTRHRRRVAPVGVERDFGIAHRLLDARNAAMRVDANGALVAEQVQRRAYAKVQPRGCGCAADSIEACRDMTIRAGTEGSR